MDFDVNAVSIRKTGEFVKQNIVENSGKKVFSFELSSFLINSLERQRNQIPGNLQAPKQRSKYFE